MNSTQSLLALHLTGVIGPRRLQSARDAFPDLQDIWGASLDLLGGLPDWTVACAKKVLSFSKPLERVEAELEIAFKHGFKVLVEGEEGFPKVFKDLYDPPFVLWMAGDYRPEDEKAIAIIGCRKPSNYGRQIGLKFAEDVAKSGYTVVSGLARGIDSIAHQGALKYSKGRTLAFLGSGLLNLYPPENKKLAGEIKERGAVFSEYPLHSKPLALHFPQRNRLISGAAKGVLVIEAKKDSGSFITVDHALDQGRTVFAVPGHIENTQSEGTNALIQQGAKLVMRIEDLLHEFQDLAAETVLKSRRSSHSYLVSLDSLSEEEKVLLDKLAYTPVHVDAIARETQIPLRRLNELLLTAEMKGLIQQAPGHCYFRA